MQSVRFRSGIRVRVSVGFCSAHVLAQFRLRGGMKFIPLGMADISRRLRPQADTAGIGTRKPASTPVGVAERWHPYRGAEGIIRFHDRWYRPDGLNHRLMSANPTGFLDLLPSFPKPGTKNSINVDTIPSHKPRSPGSSSTRTPFSGTSHVYSLPPWKVASHDQHRLPCRRYGSLQRAARGRFVRWQRG